MMYNLPYSLQKGLKMTDFGTHNMTCQFGCGLFQKAKEAFVPDEIPENAEVVFVSDIPLNETYRNLIDAGMKDEPYVYGYAHLVKCVPARGRTPNVAFQKCPVFLNYGNPKILVLLGQTVCKYFSGYDDIEKWHGSVVRLENMPVMILLNHPRDISNQTITKNQFIEDYIKIFDELEGNGDYSADHHYEYIYVDTLDKAEQMFSEIKIHGKSAFDLEFKSLRAFSKDNAIFCASFATDTKAWTLPIDHKESPFGAVEKSYIIKLLKEFAQDESIIKIGHNLKIDFLVLYAVYGVELKGILQDSMLVSKILRSSGGGHSLKDLASYYLRMHYYDKKLDDYVSEHPDTNPRIGGSYGNIPMSILNEYAAKDASATYLLHAVLYDLLDVKERILYDNLYTKLTSCFSHIEIHGMMPDFDIIREYREIYRKNVDDLYAELRQFDVVQRLEREQRVQYNPASSQQTEIILYDYLGYKPTYYNVDGKKITAEAYDKMLNDRTITDKTRVTRSVASGAIKWYTGEFIDRYKLYVTLNTALNKVLTKVDGWVDDDGLIRSEYNIIGTETMRTSSTNPNMQNIPSKYKFVGTLLESHPLKNIFKTRWENGHILSLDYSSMEMRMMGCIADSKLMKQMFVDKVDQHAFVASKIHNCSIEEVTSVVRSLAKSVNWTMIFGGSPYTIHKDHGIPLAEAERFYNGWNDMFPEVKMYNNRCIDFAKGHGYVESLLGAKRYFEFLPSDKPSEVSRKERELVNHPIQSVASHLMLMSLVLVDRILKNKGMKSLVVNTVHDSMIIDCYPGEEMEVYHIGRKIMIDIKKYAEKAFPEIDLNWLDVPLDSDGEIGYHYGELKGVEE